MTTQSGLPGDEKSLGQLVSDLSEQGARLVRAEIDLAKAEIAGRAQQLGVGGGLIVAGAVLALYLLGAGIATSIIVLDLWLAALIVCAFLLLVIVILVLIGVNRVKAGSPPTPARAIENVQHDIDAVKAGFNA